jgi:CRISPR/Cas system CMR subunit Cmr6 (Cas7 group RAMP superfamily)
LYVYCQLIVFHFVGVPVISTSVAKGIVQYWYINIASKLDNALSYIITSSIFPLNGRSVKLERFHMLVLFTVDIQFNADSNTGVQGTPFL